MRLRSAQLNLVCDPPARLAIAGHYGQTLVQVVAAAAAVTAECYAVGVKRKANKSGE
jgi:hypothetical protein